MRPAHAASRTEWPRPLRGAFAVIVGLGLLTAAAPALAQQTPDAAYEWAPDLAPAMEAYLRGDYAGARQFCTQLAAASRDERVRFDAAALRAMTLLHGDARDDRLAGRARLAQLIRQEPSLGSRPECLLALGVGHAGLNETAAALDYLDQATTGFAQRGRSDRWAAALCRLAETWAIHGEWETTPPRLGVRRPENPAQASAFRREQIDRVRQRLAERAGDRAALDRVDLVLARLLLEEPSDASAAIAALDRLAQRSPLTPPAAEAALLLAERFEQSEHGADALSLYERVRDAGFGDLSQRAERASREMTRPALSLEAPTSVRTGQRVSIRLRARNVGAVVLEVRQVDLAGWLERRRGALVEAQLPVSGSVRLARELPTVAGSLSWWDSAEHEPLSFDGPPGAYVVYARAAGDDDAPGPLAKRLVIISDLRAALIVGARQAVIWAVRDAGFAEDEPAAQFWMHGTTFVPKRPDFHRGVARFELPAEARLMREKRWACLIRAGEHLALCRGALRLEAPDDSGNRAMVALIGAPPNPHAGRTLRVTGLLLDAGRSTASPEPVDVELLDVLDAPVAARQTPIDTGGTFEAEFPITAAMAGKHLRIVARRSGQTLEQAHGTLNIPVARADVPSIAMQVEMEPLFGPETDAIALEVEAVYLWGVPLIDAPVGFVVRGAEFAPPSSGDPPASLLPFSARTRLNARGHATLRARRDELDWSVSAPTGFGVWVDVRGWEGRHAADQVMATWGRQRMHGWLRTEPDSPVVGRPMRFGVGWFDPAAAVGVADQAVTVRDAGGASHVLPLYATPDGLWTEVWQPDTSGPHEVTAALVDTPRDGLRLQRSFEVAPSAGEAPSADTGVFRAVWDDSAGSVAVRTGGASGLVLLYDDQEPWGAAPANPDSSETHLAVQMSRTSALRAALLRFEGDRLTPIIDKPVRSARGLRTRAEVAAGLFAGEDAAVSVRCTDADGAAVRAAVVARLIDARTHGTVHWAPGAPRSRPTGSGLTVADSDAGEQTSLFDAAPSRERLSPELFAGLYEGLTLWTATGVTDDAGALPLDVPLPDEPALYRLIVTARDDAGGIATHRIALDARAGLLVKTDAPPTLTVGDRSVAAIRVTNTFPQPVSLRVGVQGDERLGVESLRALGAAAESTHDHGKAALAIPLAVGQSTTVLAQLEAAAVGTARIDMRVEAGPVRRAVTLACEVMAEPVEPDRASGDAVPVQRTVYTLTPASGTNTFSARQLTDSGVEPMDYLHSVLEQGERIEPGQLLLVRDEFQLQQPWRSVRWSQRVPATCYTINYDPVGLQQLGQGEPDRLDRLEFDIPSLPPGARMHEFCMVAVRPGNCALPPPTIQVAGREIPVALQSNATHVSVNAGP